MKAVRTTLISVAMAVALMLVASAWSWGYYANGADHYIATILASPFFLAAKVGNSAIATALAFALYFAVCFALVSLFNKVAKAWHR